MSITVVGAGLAGGEAAFSAASAGIKVTLLEMKPEKYSPAHKMPGFAELVCSNSLKAERLESAGGLLKEEMRIMGSLCVETAYRCRVPAGGALAVNREQFSRLITETIAAHPLIDIKHCEAAKIPDGVTVIATGPLTSDMFAAEIESITGGYLSFYDAAAPIVTGESIDMENAFFAARYGRGGDDYVNCPMNKEQYDEFYDALISAERAQIHAADKVYEGCMPIEVLAKRGKDTPRFGPLKPAGITDPATGRWPWAVLQLRREDNEGKLYNLVGFQTNLKFGEQKRVFSMIPALKNAEFVRYGVMHRNTFINSPMLINRDLSLKSRGEIFFAGQITGAEGYMESAALGILAGINAARLVKGESPLILPEDTMTGAIMKYITTETKDFQPMGANFGLLPPPETNIRGKKERYAQLAKRATDSLLKVCGDKLAIDKNL